MSSKNLTARNVMDCRGPASITLSQIPPFKVNGVQAHSAEAGRSHTNHGFTSVSKVNVREVDIFTLHNHMIMDAQRIG